jgi:hypothetical protein
MEEEFNLKNLGMKGYIKGIEVEIEKRFIEPLEVMIAHGYKPLAVTIMICEDTFCFETAEEAERAGFEFETNPVTNELAIQGWWYGKEDFIKAVREYQKTANYEMTIIWLDKEHIVEL